MAVLADADRRTCWAEFMRDNAAPCGVTKPDLRAAVNAIDQWVSDNAASLNAAIPLPARTALTAAQKARLLVYTIRKRFETGA